MLDILTLEENIITFSNYFLPFTLAFCFSVIIYRIVKLGNKCFDDDLFYESIKTIGVAVICWVLIRVMILISLIIMLYL